MFLDVQAPPIADPDERGLPMHLTITVLGLELLHLDLSTDPDDTDVKAYGDVVSAATAEPGQVPCRDGYEDKARTGFA